MASPLVLFKASHAHRRGYIVKMIAQLCPPVHMSSGSFCVHKILCPTPPIHAFILHAFRGLLLTCPHEQDHNNDEDLPSSQLLVFLSHLLHRHLICTGWGKRERERWQVDLSSIPNIPADFYYPKQRIGQRVDL